MAERAAERKLSFGSFVLLPEQRQLLLSGQKVRLGSRAFDLLVALANQAGQVVSKEQLIAAAWPGVFIEESSLRVHISALRKVLGDDQGNAKIIENIPGRGYCFIAALNDDAPAHVTLPPAPSAPRLTLPRLGSRVIGRKEIIDSLSETVIQRRLVTLVGSGGIGKTTVAIAAATQIAHLFPDGAAFVNLAAVSAERQVPDALATALGHITRSDEPIVEMVAALADKHLLLVLDNCEHVVGAVAALAEALAEAPGVHILATSRELLRADGEWVQRLPSLALPKSASGRGLGGAVTAAEAMESAAVELFTERAAAALGGYQLTDEDAPLVIEICGRLDGIALAIELAAGRIGSTGLHALARSIDDCLRVLTHGRRTALPRHQTLRATLDWSYQLLSPPEQAVFRRLCVFNGPFTIEAARAVCRCETLPAAQIDECVHSLVGKSLTITEMSNQTVEFRLLTTTRAFGREQLELGREQDQAARRHANWLQSEFDRAQLEWEARPTAEWLAEYGRHLLDLHSALEWALTPDGDPMLGVALTVAAVPLWFELSQVDECLGWVRRALTIVEADPASYARERMQLHAVLGWPSMRAIAGFPSGSAAWTITLALAEELNDLDFRLRAIWALWVARTNAGEPRDALILADQFCRLEDEAETPIQHRLGQRMRARSLHLLGRPDEGEAAVKTMLARYVAPIHRSHVARFQYEQRITARITLGRVLWVQGRSDQAMREMEDNIADAISLGHVLTLTHALSDGACPIALLAGRLSAADHFIGLLKDNTSVHALDVWHAYAQCFQGELLIRRYEVAAGVALLTGAIESLDRSGFVLYRTIFLCALAKGLAYMGRFAEGVAAVDDGLAQCERTGEAWCRPELARIHGLLSLGQSDPVAAERWFRRSLEDSENQGALSWSLRSATDLAKLFHDRGDTAQAYDMLAPIHGRFSEGFATPDYLAASKLLSTLRPSTTSAEPIVDKNIA